MILDMEIAQNPIHALYRAKSSLVARTRSAVLRDVRRVSPRLALSAERVLDRKMADRLPPLGEMLPWVLGELSGIAPTRLDGLAKGWLAIYLYGHLVDDRADRGERLTSEEQMLCWILFQRGLKDIHSMTIGTPFEEPFEQYLASAVRYQLHDLSDRGRRTSSRRAQYSAGKNHCLVACAAAVAATASRPDPGVVRFTLRLLPGIQHLDDIADMGEDAKQGNYTVLLAKAMNRRRHSMAMYSQSDLVEHAIRSAALENVLRATDRALRGAKTALGARQWRMVEETPSGLFFDQLSDAVGQVSMNVHSARLELLDPTSDPATRKRLVRDVHRKLDLVAQGS